VLSQFPLQGIASQAFFYGAIRGAPMAARLIVFFVAAASLNSSGLAAIAVLHATIDFAKVTTDLGLDTYAVKRFARRPLSFFFLFPSLVALKTAAAAISFVFLYCLFRKYLENIPQPIVILVFASNFFYCMTGILISQAQARFAVQRLLPISFLCYSVFSMVAFAVYVLGAPLTICYAALFLSEFALFFLAAVRLANLRDLVHRVSARAMPILLRGVLPLTITVAIGVIYQRIDFFAANAFLTESDAADYALMQRLNEPIMFFLSAMSVTWFARLSSSALDGAKLLNRAVRVGPFAFIVGFVASASLLTSAGSLGVSAVYTNLPVCVYLSFGMGLKGVVLTLTAIIQAKISFWVITSTSAFVLALQAGLLFYTVPEGGLVAAAQAQAITDCLNMLLQLFALIWFSRRKVA
jgi:O-antigen/teichoic acid export membrane protein